MCPCLPAADCHSVCAPVFRPLTVTVCVCAAVFRPLTVTVCVPFCVRCLPAADCHGVCVAVQLEASEIQSVLQYQNIIIQHMDISQPLTALRKLLETRLQCSLADHEFYLQDTIQVNTPTASSGQLSTLTAAISYFAVVFLIFQIVI